MTSTRIPPKKSIEQLRMPPHVRHRKTMVHAADPDGPKNLALCGYRLKDFDPYARIALREDLVTCGHCRRSIKSRDRILSPKEEAVFRFIVAYKRRNDGNSPTIREIQSELRLSSTSVVNYYVHNLVLARKITLIGSGGRRGIRVLGATWDYDETLENDHKVSYK